MTPAGKTCRCFYAGEGRTDFGAGEGLAGLWGALLFRMAIRRGAGGRAESHPASMTRDSFAARNSHWRSLTRRLRRELGLAVPRGAHTFLSVAKEKCAKESQRHGDSRGGPPRCASRASSCGSPSGCPRPRFASLTRREKALYCPFWRRGSLCRAQRSWPAYAYHRARSELAFFRRQNGRAFFPPLPIAALLRRSWRWAYLSRAGWEASKWLVGFAALVSGWGFFFQLAVGRFTPCGLGCFLVVWVFLPRKRPAGFQIHAGLCCEP